MYKKAVCVLITNEEGKLLSVSRKDNPSDIGLIGGKVDDGESLIDAVIRETFEECGLVITKDDLYKVFFDFCGDYSVTTYFCNKIFNESELHSDEKGVLKFVDYKDLLDSSNSYHQYNNKLINKIASDFPEICYKIGLKFNSNKLIIDEDVYNKLPDIMKIQFTQILYMFYGDVCVGEFFDEKAHKITKKYKTLPVKKYHWDGGHHIPYDVVNHMLLHNLTFTYKPYTQ